MKELAQKLKRDGVLKTPAVIAAFLACDRAEFVPLELADAAYADTPLPTLRGQTISQPYTVAFMLELLQARVGQKILDVGFGSGWTTAILAEIVGSAGKVFGLEVVPDLYEFGRLNLAKFRFQNVELRNQTGWEGLPEAAPFDRILVSAAASEVPAALKDQLAPRGRMVIPVQSSVWLLEKSEAGSFRQTEYPGFAFVPLVRS